MQTPDRHGKIKRKRGQSQFYVYFLKGTEHRVRKYFGTSDLDVFEKTGQWFHGPFFAESWDDADEKAKVFVASRLKETEKGIQVEMSELSIF